MIAETALLILGFAMLIGGADIFVKASVNIARRLKIPSVVIGLTVVAIGTSAPEIVISLTAALKQSNTMAVGNAIGSNMFNLLLIVGICAFIRPLAVKFKEISREFYISAGAAVLLLAMAVISGSSIHPLLALLLLLSFIAYMVILVRKTLKEKGADAVGGAQKDAEDGVAKDVLATKPLALTIFLAVAGCAVIIIGGQLTVDSASALALRFGMSQRMIGLTIVAIGTSLPELVVCLVACKKGEGDVALGNVIGSSIFNILFVLGLVGLVSPLPVDINVIIDLAILSAGSMVSLLFAYTDQRIVRAEGIFLVLIYTAYMIYVILR